MKKLVIGLLLGLLALNVDMALADVSVSLNFPVADFAVASKPAKGTAYDFVQLKGCSYIGSPRKPMLPMKTIYLSIPAGEEPSSVEVSYASTQNFNIINQIYPAQYPIAADGTEKNTVFAEPSALYSVNACYPGTGANVVHSGSLGGYKIAAVNVFPVQYNPVTKKLTLATSVNLTLKTKPSTLLPYPANRRTEQQDRIYRKMAMALVANPYSVPVMQLSARGGETVKPLKLTQLPSRESDAVPYIIITEAPLDTVFQRLADWKTKKGLPTIVKKVSWISQNYFGVDLQDKIRNFIRDCYSNWGTYYVLLGGGPEIVPCRYTRNFSYGFMATVEALSIDNVPCDMYYSDLDGTWNTDGDNYFGEGPVITAYIEEPPDTIIDYNDVVDMYPEVFVGRASVDNIQQAQTFVKKVMTYENNALAVNTNYANKICFMAGLMDTTDEVTATNTDVTKEGIYNASVPLGAEVTKLYNTWPLVDPRPLRKTTAWSVLNDSLFNIINHIDHGGWNKMVTGNTPDRGVDNGIYMYETDTLRNGDSLYILLLFMNCTTNAFDLECFGEHIMNCPTGGPAAYVGNTRGGWYIKNDSKNSPSNKFDESFFKYLFKDETNVYNFYNIGQTLAMAKMDWIGIADSAADIDSSGNGPTMRFCMFELNLLGDPEMPIWTKQAQTLIVSHPTTITLSDTVFTVAIKGTDGDTVTVCAQKGTEAYAVKEKVLAGGGPQGMTYVTFYYKPNTTGTINVTVTGHNYLPYQGTCSVIYNLSANPYVSSCRLSDSLSGNRDCVLNPGETVNMYATVKNSGKLGVFGITVKAVPDDSLHLISFSDDTAYIAVLKAGAESVICQFKMTLPSTLPLDIDYYAFNVNFGLTTASLQWKDNANITARADSLVHTGHKTNGNVIYPQITNIASGAAYNVTAKLRTADPNVLISDSVSYFGTIKACSTKFNAVDGFAWSYIQNPIEDEPPHFTLVMKDAFGRSWSDNFAAVPGILPPDSFWCSNKPNSIELYWAYNGYARPTGLSGFNVYRSQVKDGPYVRINLLPLNSMLYYSDNAIDPYKAYYYRVTAVDTCGNESEYTSVEIPRYPLIRGWPQYSGRPISVVRTCNSSPVVTDINCDGLNEVVLTSFEGALVYEMGPMPNGKVYGWQANGTALEGFPKEIGYAVETSPCVADFNGDDSLEILHGDGNFWRPECNTGQLYVWKHDGSSLTGWPAILGNYIYDAPASADVNGDGYLEAAVSSFFGNSVIVCNQYGVLTGWPQSTTTAMPYSPIFAQLDLDGDLEIIATEVGSKMHAWNADGTPVAGWPVDLVAQYGVTSNMFICAPVAGDIDNDGQTEVVTFINHGAEPAASGLAAWNADGTLKWDCGLGSYVRVEAMITPALGDINRDGLLEAVVSTNDGRTHCVSSTGSEMWSVKLSDVRINSSALIGDVNADGRMEIVVNATNKIYVLNENGKILPGFPFETTIPLSHIMQPCPTLADLDKNGTVDIVYRGYDQIYAWDLMAHYDRSKIEWGTYRHDFARTGNYHTLPQGVFSMSNSATAYNNARHLVYGLGDTLHLVYNSNDSIVYKSSANDGYSWTSTAGFAAGGSNPVPCIGLNENNKILIWRAETAMAGWVLKTVQKSGDNWSLPEIILEEIGGWDEMHQVSPPAVVVNGAGTHLAIEKIYTRYNLTRPGYVWFWKLLYGFRSVGSDAFNWTILDSAQGEWSEPPENPASPSICLDGNGAVHIAWDYDGEIYWKVFDPIRNEWGNRVSLSNSPDVLSEEPSLNFHGDVHVVWQEGNDICHRYGNWGVVPNTKAELPSITGFYWAEPEDVSKTPETQSLAPVYDGNYVAWSEASGDGNSEICVSVYNNLLWNYLGNCSQSPLTPSVYPQLAYRQNVDDNIISMVWSEGYGTYYNITGKSFTGPATSLLSANVGDTLQSIYTLQRDGFIVYPVSNVTAKGIISGSAIAVDYDSTALLYYLPYLDKEKTQIVKVGLYQLYEQKGRKEYNYKVSVNNNSIGVVKVPSGQSVVFEAEIPEKAAEEGRAILEIQNLNGEVVTCDWWEVYTQDDASAPGGSQSEEGVSVAPNYVNALCQNCPNPFGAQTSIFYQLKSSDRVTIKIYNALGQAVKTLVDEVKPAGVYRTEWDGRDANGMEVSSGIYLYKMNSGTFGSTKKMVVLK